MSIFRKVLDVCILSDFRAEFAAPEMRSSPSPPALKGVLSRVITVVFCHLRGIFFPFTRASTYSDRSAVGILSTFSDCVDLEQRQALR